MWLPDMSYADVMAGFYSVMANDAFKGMGLLLFALALAGKVVGLVRSAGE